MCNRLQSSNLLPGHSSGHHCVFHPRGSSAPHPVIKIQSKDPTLAPNPVNFPFFYEVGWREHSPD